MIADLNELSRILSTRRRNELPTGKLGRAAVLVGLYGPAPDYQVLYTVRTSRVEHHKGQISFPGGRCDDTDTCIEHTALRETLEEIGVRSEHIKVIGLLDDMTTSSQFTVTPVLARIDLHPYEFMLHEAEVDTLLSVPLSHLADPANLVPAAARPEGSPAPSYKFGDHVIWGATGRMTAHFLELIQTMKAPTPHLTMPLPPLIPLPRGFSPLL